MALLSNPSLSVATVQGVARNRVPVKTSQTNVIPADQASIYDALTTLQTSNPTAYNAIVRPNNPPAGIGGFLFDIPGDEEVRLKSAISRHFVENNTPISDHIALDPEQVTVRGLVAELVAGVTTPSPVAAIANVLPLLGVMMPPLTIAQTAAAAATAVGTFLQTQSLSGQQSLYQYFQATAPGRANLTRQQNAALFFQQAWWGRQLFSVETPWGIWTNMAISDVRMLQSKESRYISDFAIVFERIRVAGDITVQPGQAAGRNVFQRTPQATTPGSTTPATVSQQLGNTTFFFPQP